MKRVLLQFILGVFFIPQYVLLAQQVERGNNDTGMAKQVCHLVYPLGSAEIRLELGNNAEVLSQLDSFIYAAIIDSHMHIRRIRLVGYCSIEGPYMLNERLAYNRVDSFRDYLCMSYPELYRYPVDVVWVAEDWGGLSHLVRESELQEKEDVLEIMCNVRSFDTRESLLVKLNSGRTYWYMQRFFFDQLRRVEIEIEYDTTQPKVSYEKTDPLIYSALESNTNRDYSKTDPEVVSQTLDAAVNQLPKEPEEEEPKAPSGYRVFEGGTLGRPLFALKTNALLWAGVQSDFNYTTPVANVALEYYINDHWSVELGAMYSYWHYNSDREFQGVSGYRLEPRYRFGFPNEWLDIYLGLYGRVGDYDSRTIDSSQPTLDSPLSTLNYTGDYWDAGLSAGLTFYLGKSLGIEVGARAGYLQTDAIRYTPDGKYNRFKSRESYQKMRITDLNVSFIYRFR